MTAAGTAGEADQAYTSSFERTDTSSHTFDWDNTPHPDFQADAGTANARARRVDSRWVLLALLLLVLIPVGWWLWANILSGSRPEPSTQGAVVTLPTLAATTGAEDSVASGGGQSAGGIVTAASAEAGNGAPVVAATVEATATAEPTATDLENVAATATAIFAGATPVVECAAPSWWMPYITAVGDTIESLAAARGILPEELIVANCLAGPELAAGTSLLLPPVGIVITLPGGPTPTPIGIASNVPTRPPGLPTSPPVLFPTPTFPVVIVSPTVQPTQEEPTDEPPTRPPNRPTAIPTSVAQPTATPPRPFGTTTPPSVLPTSTPPSPGTVTPTSTAPPLPITIP